MVDINGFQYWMQVYVKDEKSFYNSPLFTGHLIKYDEEKNLYTVQVLWASGMILVNYELAPELLAIVPPTNPLAEDEAAEDISEKPKSFDEVDDTKWSAPAEEIEVRWPDAITRE